MKKYFYWVLLLPFAYAVVNAQTSCEKILGDAKKEEESREFFKAYLKYEAALRVCPNKEEIENRKRNAVKELEKLKNEAEKLKDDAMKAENKAKKAQQAAANILNLWQESREKMKYLVLN